MAIVKEFYRTRIDGVNLYRTYSDEQYKIRQIETGNIYDEAIDIETSNYTYEETDEKKEQTIDSDIELKAKAYDILIGEVE
jgi:hypothetical protein